MTIKFLVVVPTLNSYQLLPKFTQSLQSQTFQDWRCLFIDGPSSKEHRQWLNNCCQADQRFQWSEQKPQHQKIFGAMNQGFQEAKPEEWILFWGSDDWAADSTVLQNWQKQSRRKVQTNQSTLSSPKVGMPMPKGSYRVGQLFHRKEPALTSTQQASEENCFLGKHPLTKEHSLAQVFREN